MPFNTKDSLLIFPFRQLDAFIAVFARIVVFGTPKDQKFQLNECFFIDLHCVKSFYQAINEILLNWLEEQHASTELNIFGKYDCFTYCWKVLESKIYLTILIEDETKANYIFSYEQFNELIYLYSNCLLFSLCLPNVDLEFLNLASNLDFLKLIEIYDDEKTEIYLKSLKTPFSKDVMKYKTLLYVHFDILIIKNKLQQICNDSLLPNSFKDLL